MVFTSHLFVFYFLPALLLLYYMLPGRFPTLRNVLLLVAGYAFYAWANPWFAALLFGMTAVNYLLARLIATSGTPRARLLPTVCAVVIDLAVLGFFKYIVFFADNLNRVLLFAGLDVLPVLRVILPVGLSFYTFKLISYVVDTFRDPSAPTRSPLNFACYVSFFPQLLSGPIQRYGTIDPKSLHVPTFAAQLLQREHTVNKFAWGAALFMLGFSKKILVADVVAQVADAVFAAEAPSTLDAWFGALAYSFQLYFDFSAYSEIAIGLGLMFGFECPRNFAAPYRADSFSDFWRRWHISLSSWLRDYLYIPLGGNRAGTGRTYVNLIVVFLLCGLWHGAGWTFIVWGAWHGLWLVVERSLGRKTFYAALHPFARVLLTFLLLTIGWTIFRASTLTEALKMLAIMFLPTTAQGGSVLLSAVIYTPGNLILMVLCVVLAFQPVQAFDWTRKLNGTKTFVISLLFALALMTMFAQAFRSFLYFQF